MYMEFTKQNDKKWFLYKMIEVFVVIGSVNGLIDSLTKSKYNIIRDIFNKIGLSSIPIVIFITASLSAILYHIVKIFILLKILK